MIKNPSYELGQIFPGKDVTDLRMYAAEINKARAFDHITDEEQTVLLESLLDSQNIIEAADKHDRQVIVNKVINILKLIPIPI